MKIGQFTTNGKTLEITGEDYITKKVQILAKTDSGKTYTASKIAEELLKEKIPIVIVDPVSAYWGLKEKFEIVIFADKRNKHVDYPLNDDKKTIDSQAELIADYLATNKTSAIIDLKYWVESKQQQFMAKFAERLYHKIKIPRHVFIEEADIFIPQSVVYPDEINSRHHVDNLVRRGRQEGIGCTVISQRPALVSKNVLTQSDLSIYLNLPSKPDLTPAKKEIEDDADMTKQQQQAVISRIKKLPRGEAFFYSPRWLGIKEFVRINKKETYHAGATRGATDWRADEDIILKPVNIEDVKEMLLSIATEDNDSTMLQAIPQLADTKMLERQYKDQISKKDAEIATLRNQLVIMKNENEALQSLKVDSEILNSIRALLHEQPSQEMPRKQEPKPSKPRQSRNGHRSSVEWINDLWHEGFFVSEKALGDVNTEIKQNGFNLDLSAISHALRNAVRSRILKRVGTHGNYRYIQKEPPSLPEITA